MKISLYIVLVFTVILNYAGHTQTWEAPAEASSKVSPVEKTPENIKLGKELYLKVCKSCHGDLGKNNVLPLPTGNPPDLGSAKVQENSPGAIHYFITTGRVTMPKFESIIPDEDRWRLALYIKSYGEVDQTKASVLKGQPELKVEIDQNKEKISAYLNEIIDTVAKPVEGVRIDFAVKRYFGDLKFASAKTDKKGFVSVAYPKDIAGDSTGCVTLVVKTDPDVCTAESLVENAPICSVHYATNIFEKRIMWSENDKTQWWVILSYLGVVGGVWLTILYVVTLIVRIARMGKAG